MNKSSESYKVYLEKAGDAASGIVSSQPEGRASLPQALEVKNAEAAPKGTAKKRTDEQVGENRYYINSYVAKCQGEPT
jgi:hypothetical protein